MGKPKAPKPPNPVETAAAQTSQNIGTAVAQQGLNMVGQNTPYGSLAYNQTGTMEWKDPLTGKVYKLPQFTATTTLSPEQQAILDQTNKAELNIGTAAANQSGRLVDAYSSPFDGNSATEAKLMEYGRSMMDPIWSQRQKEFEQSMANKGIVPGSQAYENASRAFNDARSRAYTDLALQGRGQAFNEALTLRNQPINEWQGMLGISQPQNPSFVSTPQTGVANTDYAGLVQNNYANQMAAYQQKQAQQQSLLGGLFGLGAKLGSSMIMASDRRVKKDIAKVGKIKGHNVYEYRYKGEPDTGGKHIGLMAQEVEKKAPDAVLTDGRGMKLVDYGRALA